MKRLKIKKKYKTILCEDVFHSIELSLSDNDKPYINYNVTYGDGQGNSSHGAPLTNSDVLRIFGWLQDYLIMKGLK